MARRNCNRSVYHCLIHNHYNIAIVCIIVIIVQIVECECSAEVITIDIRDP